MPPERLIRKIGPGDFRIIGNEFFHHFVTKGGLRPDAHVLDVGCGCGRMAIPLTRYLTSGSYEGFDASRVLVAWCQDNITPNYPNFRFQHVDVLNQAYNSSGKIRPSELRFPYGDGSFDFVFLCSVFTHMLALDLEHYISEITRVLKDEGTSFITFFLLNAESEQLLTEKRSSEKFLQVS